MLTRSVPRTAAANMRQNPASPWRHLDLVLVGAVIVTSCLGVVMVYSATKGTEGTTYLARQLAFVVIGIAAMGAATLVDYRRFRDFAPMLYLGCLALLFGVLSPLGTEVNGSQSWFAVGPFQLQPAEFTKLATVLLVAGLCSGSKSVMDVRMLFAVLLTVAVPAGLIMLQPDLGSTMVFGAILLGMLVVAGVSPRHLAVLGLVAVVGMIAVFQFGFLEEYQKDRLTYFASQTKTEASYNAEQAETAIGAGGLTGAGLFQGLQTKAGYVPYQQSDFIFTVVGEELGFIGSATLLLLYCVIAWRIWRAAAVARDMFGTLLCVGVLAMLLFQIFENMGMTMGIMPITGIPLPFLSYGGSSTIMVFIAIGLVVNVHTRRFS
jgi:rod shape determining protein RodA